MTNLTSGGCTVTQPGGCNYGTTVNKETSPWDASGTTAGSGCWTFDTHSIVCDHTITADTIHIRFNSNVQSSTLGYKVESLNSNGKVIELVLDVGKRSGLNSEESLSICTGS